MVFKREHAHVKNVQAKKVGGGVGDLKSDQGNLDVTEKPAVLGAVVQSWRNLDAPGIS